MNCIVYAAMTRWAFPFAVPVVDQLRSVWSQRWANIGTWSISCAPSVRNPFSAIGITRSVGWPTARRTIISSLETYALYATRLLGATVCKLNWLGLKLINLINFLFSTVFTALNKAWCVHHFACSVCDTKMTQKSKFYEYDEKPVCKKCYERFPNELRRRLRTAHEMTMKKSV